MATVGEWVAGARPRTLPAAVVPVVVGTAVAIGEGGWSFPRALLALVVALALQIGVNYANDYSDGVRGTDAERVGPLRLTATGLAAPVKVRTAAFAWFGVAAVAGLVLSAMSSWWLPLVGLAAILAAWYYTGGERPYGYRALGEVSVFVFFGFVAVVGTVYVQLLGTPWLAWAAAVPVGLLACALLVVNNLRDIPTDRDTGKRTLAVVLGDTLTRRMYVACVAASFAIALAVAVVRPFTLLTLLAVPVAVGPAKAVLGGGTGRGLVPALGGTGRLQMVFGLLFSIGLAL
ncbi:MAG: 1,4-dihydroxy-2-naphthoate polyprenyltransferase [Streptosporangiales bacterium]|nr:1,4-dihydroxy-2-naphthoate polyprenyltransferase [Streptosporangiales bacterium]